MNLMDLMNVMNYCLDNKSDPRINKVVDIGLARYFIKKPRKKEDIERFYAYGSMSLAHEEIESMLKYMLSEQKEDTIQKVA